MGPDVILALASTALGVVGQIQQAQTSAGNARFQAEIARQHADAAIQAAAVKEAAQRRRNRRALGSLRVKRGASGLAAEGAPLEVIGDVASELELDALTIRHQGLLAARGHRINAEVKRARAGQDLLMGMTDAAAGAASFGDALISAADEA